MLNFLVTETTLCTGTTFDIPNGLYNVVSGIVKLIQIGIPILLIIFGMIDLGKAVIAQKEDEIKKGQQTFIRRLIAAIIVFFVVFVVQLVVSFATNITGDTGIWDCVYKFIEGV